MKKLLALVMAILIVFLFIPTSVSASKQTQITKNEVIELACQVFPEYEVEIKGENLTSISSRSVTNFQFGEFIIEETRKASTGEEITYQQDEGGHVIVTFNYDNTIVESSHGTGYAYRKCNLVMYCNISDELLRVNGLEYTHVYNGYDVISSYGSTSASTATVQYVIGNIQETSTTKASVEYHVSFTVNKLGLNGVANAYLHVKIGNDSFSYSAVAE